MRCATLRFGGFAQQLGTGLATREGNGFSPKGNGGSLAVLATCEIGRGRRSRAVLPISLNRLAGQGDQNIKADEGIPNQVQTGNEECGTDTLP
jgi:hypothetical protein